MNIEKFTKKNKNGYKIKATVASSRNYNGVHFDPLEVFLIDTPPEKFNLNHSDVKTDYSSDTKITSKPPSPSIDGKLLKFEVDLETTNENFVKLIESGNFGGFSPELRKINNFSVVSNNERFYAPGDLVWEATAILEKGVKPGFVKADENTIEKFKASEDVVIINEKENFSQENTDDFDKEALKKEIVENVTKEVKELFYKEKEEDKSKEKEEKEKFQKMIETIKNDQENFNKILKEKGSNLEFIKAPEGQGGKDKDKLNFSKKYNNNTIKSLKNKLYGSK